MKATHIFGLVAFVGCFETTAIPPDPAGDAQLAGDTQLAGDAQLAGDFGTACPPPCSLDGIPPAPWDTLTWTFTEIDVDQVGRPPGYQGGVRRSGARSKRRSGVMS